MQTDAITIEGAAPARSIVAQKVVMEANVDAPLSPLLSTGAAHLRADAITIEADELPEPLQVAPHLAVRVMAEENATIGAIERLDLRIESGRLPEPWASVRSVGFQIGAHGLDRQGIEAFLRQMRDWEQRQLSLAHRLDTHPNDPQQLAEAMALQRQMQDQSADMMRKVLRVGVSRWVVQARARSATPQQRLNELNASVRLIAPLPAGKGVAALQRWMRSLSRYVALDAQATVEADALRALGSVGSKYLTLLKAIHKQGFVAFHDGLYTASLHYTPSELVLNGKSMPKLLWMIRMMGVGGLF
jgi:hypothetical protein